MDAGRQGACARNNALWCDTVLKAAGVSTRSPAGFWHANGKVLPLYPSAITLSVKPGPEFFEVLDTLPANAAVKDSFATLDLASMGFRKLFTGTWLFRPAQASRRPPLSVQRQKVAHSAALKEWLAAWNVDERLHGVFPPKLLETQTVEFAAIRNGSGLKAGAVFNSGPTYEGKEMIGLSNLFCRRNWRYSALRELLEPYPHRPVCTYESELELLPVYRELGFEGSGSLSVWLKT